MRRTYRAKVVRVIDHSVLDLSWDLGFNVRYRAKVRLDGLENLPTHCQKGAQSALIRLVGGHRVVVSVDDAEDTAVVTGKVYLYQPVDMPGVADVISDKRLSCLNSIMVKLSESGYAPSVVEHLVQSMPGRGV